MINPKTELLKIREQFPQYSVQCALLWCHDDNHTNQEEWVLKLGHTEEDYQKWLDSIDFECDGRRNADRRFAGFVWLDDDAWFDWHYSRWLIRQRPPLLQCVRA